MPHRFNNSLLLLPLFVCIGFSPAKYQFVWDDINTREVIRWEGDTAVIKQGTQMQELECMLRIDEKDVMFASESFGIPETWTTISYTDEQDLAKKQQNLEINFWTVNVLNLEEKKENKLLKIDIESVLEYPFPKPILKYLNEYFIT